MRSPLVVLGLLSSSLQVARSLGRRGVSVFGIDARPNLPARRSRFIRSVRAEPGAAGLARALERLAGEANGPPVVIAVTDNYLNLLAEAWPDIGTRVLTPGFDPNLIERVRTKSGLAGLLGEIGAAHPLTVACPRGSPRPRALPVPCVVKPECKDPWVSSPDVRAVFRGEKAIRFRDRTALERTLAALGGADVVVQEEVPGPSENLVYYVGYRDRRGRILTSYLGRKIRTLPDGLGTETLLRSVHIPPLRAEGDRILDRIDYHGILGIDFKLDERDRTYKVIEINFRMGSNDGYLCGAGVDLPWLYYQDSLGLETALAPEYPAGVSWIDFFGDLDWMRVHGREKGVRWLTWAREVLRADSEALFDPGDPMPFLSMATGLLRKRFAGRADEPDSPPATPRPTCWSEACSSLTRVTDDCASCAFAGEPPAQPRTKGVQGIGQERPQVVACEDGVHPPPPEGAQPGAHGELAAPSQRAGRTHVL